MIYDQKKLERILQDLYDLTRFHVTIYDLGMNYVAYTCSDVEYCRTLRTKDKKGCHLSDELSASFLNDKEYYTYTCHAGLNETIIPIKKNNKVAFYVMFGKYLLADNKESEFDLKAFCAQHSLNYTTMAKARELVNVHTVEEIESMIRIIKSIFEGEDFISSVSHTYDSLFLEIEQYIKGNFQETLTIEHLCRKFFLTKRQIYKLFQKNAGKTVNSYITDLRIWTAKHLIISTDMPLSQIAGAVGIVDYNYFVKVFKSREGLLPSELKRKSRFF